MVYKQWFWDSVNRKYDESERDLKAFMNVDDANRMARREFRDVPMDYVRWPQYKTYESADENGCIHLEVSCERTHEPLGRRWKSVYCTELRHEHPLETISRRSSFNRKSRSDDDDPKTKKKKEDTPQNRMKEKFRTGYQKFLGAMCVSANGRSINEGIEQYDHGPLFGGVYSFDDDIRYFLSTLLDRTPTADSDTSKLLSHIPHYRDILAESTTSDGRFVAAMLRYFAAGSNMETSTYPVLRPNVSTALGTCTLGLMITTNDANPVTTFTALHRETFHSEMPPDIFSPPSSRRTSADSLITSGRITKVQSKSKSKQYSRHHSQRPKTYSKNQRKNRFHRHHSDSSNESRLSNCTARVDRPDIKPKKVRFHNNKAILQHILPRDQAKQVLDAHYENEKTARELLSTSPEDGSVQDARRDSMDSGVRLEYDDMYTFNETSTSQQEIHAEYYEDEGVDTEDSNHYNQVLS